MQNNSSYNNVIISDTSCLIALSNIGQLDNKLAKIDPSKEETQSNSFRR